METAALYSGQWRKVSEQLMLRGTMVWKSTEAEWPAALFMMTETQAWRSTVGSGEDGKALYSYKDAFVSYAKDGAGWISLSASKREDLDQESSQDEAIQVYDETREIDGIAVGVTTQNYKFVPENYKLTEEEQAAIDEGNLIVSYGTEEVEEMTMANAYFDIEDVAYVIVDSNGSDMENMFAMAEKVIRAE